jgi:magnesium transporter
MLMGSVRLTVDLAGASWQDGVDPARIGELLQDRSNLVWIDIRDPGPAEIELLRRELNLHELALDDVDKIDQHQRPRCDRYEDYYFVVLYAAEHDAEQFVPRELQMLWGPSYLVTIHQGDLPIVEQARSRWLRHTRRQQHGVAYIAYALCDNLVQSYFPLQDWFGERVEETEDAVLAGVSGAVTDLFRLRKDILRTRRLLAPTADVVAEVIRREQALIPDSLAPYLADMQAHLLHVLGDMDVFRELLSAAQDVHAESMFARLALVVQRLTAITVILMVPTLVAGIYGMNFNLLFPPSDWDYGFLVVIAIMVVMIAWGFIHSRLLGWL